MACASSSPQRGASRILKRAAQWRECKNLRRQGTPQACAIDGFNAARSSRFTV